MTDASELEMEKYETQNDGIVPQTEISDMNINVNTLEANTAKSNLDVVSMGSEKDK